MIKVLIASLLLAVPVVAMSADNVELVPVTVIDAVGQGLAGGSWVTYQVKSTGRVGTIWSDFHNCLFVRGDDALVVDKPTGNIYNIMVNNLHHGCGGVIALGPAQDKAQKRGQ